MLKTHHQFIRQFGKISMASLLGVGLLGIASVFWQSQVAGQVSAPIQPTPWVGDSVGVSKLDSGGDLVNQFDLSDDISSGGINCSTLTAWSPGLVSSAGDVVMYNGSVWRANKNTGAIPKLETSGADGSNKPWYHMGLCSVDSIGDPAGVLGLLDDENILWAYRHDHRLFHIDTDSEITTEISLPSVALIGDLDCSLIDPWISGDQYKKNETVFYANHGWTATKTTTDEPSSSSNRWNDLGQCYDDVIYKGHLITNSDAMWIARGQQLIRYDTALPSGNTQDWLLNDPITGIVWDESNQQLWVATGLTLQRRSSSGSVLGQTAISNSVTAMGLELRNSILWLSSAMGSLSEYDANGVYLNNHTVSLNSITHIIPDNQGGLWVADAETVINIDNTGSILETLSPVLNPSSGYIKDITIVGDNSLWIAAQDQLWRFESGGSLTEEWTAPIVNPIIINTLTQQVTHNNAPEITSDPVVEAIQNEDYGYDIVVVDPDGDDLDYQLTVAPSGMAIDEISGSITWLPDTVGEFDVTTEVFDNRGGVDSQSFTVDVIEPDTTPPIITIASPSNGSVTEFSSVSVLGSVNEEASVTVNGIALAVQPNFSFGSDPVQLIEGLNSIQITATDLSGNVSTEIISVTFVPNKPPQITSNPITQAIVGDQYVYTVTALDPDNDPLTYSLVQPPLGMSIGQNSGLIQWTPQQAGTVPIHVLVDDGENPAVSHNFSILVEEPNTPPEFITVTLPTAMTEVSYEQDIMATDPDGDPISFELLSGPTGLSVNTAGELTWLPNTAGQFTITVKVSDTRDGETIQDFTITVLQSNRPPVFTSSPLVSVIVYQTYSYQVVATDADLDTLTFTLDQAPLGMNINEETGKIVWIPLEPSVNTIVVRATDSEGEFVTQTFDLIASFDQFDTPPIFNDLADRIVPVGTTLNLQLAAQDPEGNAIQYEIYPVPLPGGFVFSPMTGLFVIEPGVEQIGEHNFTLVADDGLYTTTTTLKITVPPLVAGNPTNFSGRILDANSASSGSNGGLDEPLVGATVSFLDTNVWTVTDENGYFVLTDIPPTAILFSIDGSTADLAPDGSSYASFIEKLPLIQNVDNIEDRPFFMPRNEMATMTPIIPNQDAVVTNARLGISLEVPANTAFNPDGTPFTGSMSISQVPEGFEPAAMPDFIDPSLLITIQPAGTEFSQPLAITFPNTDDLPDGLNMDLMSVNPDTGRFESVGTMQVSDDGQSVETISGGIIAADWHYITIVIIDGIAYISDYNPQSCPVTSGSTTCLQDGRMSQKVDLPSYHSLERDQGLTFTYQSQRAGYSDSLPDFTFPDPDPDPEPGSFGVSSVGGFGIQVMYKEIQVRGGPSTLAGLSPVLSNNYMQYITQVAGIETPDAYLQPPRPLLSNPNPVTKTYVPLESYNLDSGIYDVTLTVLMHIGASASGASIQRDVMVVNESNSDFGAGWMLDGFYRLSIQPNSGDVMLVDPAGDYKVYEYDTNTTLLTSPAADFSTLVKNPDNSYTHTDKYGIQLNFTEAGQQTTRIDRNGNTTQYEYNTQGQLVEIIDPVGLSTNLSYFAGRLKRIIYPDSRITRFRHDSLGNLTRVVYPDGSQMNYRYHGHLMTQKFDENDNRTLYHYDELGFNTKVTLADGNQRIVENVFKQGAAGTDFSAGSTHVNLLDGASSATLTDALNRETKYELDNHSRVVKSVDAIGRITLHQRNADSLPTQTTRPNGSIITRTFDALGNPTSIRENFNNALTQLQYDSNSQITQITNPNNHSVMITRDTNGNATTIVNELGHTMTIDYDLRGLPIRILTPNGLDITNQYNNEGLLTTRTETPPASSPGPVRTTTYQYYDTGLLQQVNTADGRIYQYTYDERSRLLEITDNLNQSIRYTYDDYGNVTATDITSSDNSPAITLAMSYDNRNRGVEDTIPHILNQDSITNLLLDGESNLTTLTDPNSDTDQWAYDDVDRITQHTDAINGETRYQYDLNDRITKVTGPTGIDTNYTYDLLGRVLTESSPDRGHLSYSYDKANNVISMTEGRGITTTLSYDELERLKTKTYPNSLVGKDENVTYIYDCTTEPQKLAIGRLCQRNDESGLTEYGYDAWGNITDSTFTEQGGTVFGMSYQYDAGNYITETTYPSGRTISYTRDGVQRIEAINTTLNGNAQPIASTIQYRGDNQVTQMHYGNGLIDARIYDLQGRLTQQTLTDSQLDVIDTRQYDYDPDSNLTTINTNYEDNNYQYDAKDRLITDGRINQSNEVTQYQYDLNDNRLLDNQSQDNQYTGDTIYIYQTNTNRITKQDEISTQIKTSQSQSRSMVYNDVGRLYQVLEAGQLTASYIYNDQGQRTRKTLYTNNQPTETTLYHYNERGLLITETDEQGNLIRDYIWTEQNQPLAQITDTGTEEIAYLHNDHLLTNRLATDQDQNIIWRWEGEAFGNTDPETDPDNDNHHTTINLRFPGQYQDQETNWYYNWNRYYDPEIGRYITSDPIGLDGGINTYGYVMQNPGRYTDPLGLYLCNGGGNPLACIPFDWLKSWNQVLEAAETAAELMCDGIICTAKCARKVLIGESAEGVITNIYKEYVLLRLRQTAKAVAKKALSYAVAGIGWGLAAKDVKDGVECTVNCTRTGSP